MAILVVAGLGNPEPEYAQTRHNMGFDVVNAWAQQASAIWKHDRKLKAYLTKIITPQYTVLLVKPNTYMNCSGEALQAILHYFQLKPENVAVVYDDVGLDLGRFKLSVSESVGTHNGIRNLFETIGPNFVRFRVGIGPKVPAYLSMKDFVLGKFTAAEQAISKAMFPAIISSLEMLVKEGATRAMNIINKN